jgi:hypothetical protein
VLVFRFDSFYDHLDRGSARVMYVRARFARLGSDSIMYASDYIVRRGMLRM